MKSFKNIVGNEFVIKLLKNSIKFQKLSHAYIINGYEGCGKTLIAETFAKTLLCENITNDIDACCNCKSCNTFESRNNPDVFYIHNKNNSIGIKDIKEQILNTVSIKPYKYKYKIFIIENADEITNEAQNAFLKTLEDPPKYAIFILLARNIEKFIDTLISRCIKIKIPPLSAYYIENYILKNTDIPLDKIKLYLQYSKGSIGRLLMISSSNEFIDMREKIINIILNLHGANDFYAMQYVNDIEEYKNEKNLIDIIYIWYRDILCFKVLNDEKYIIQYDKKDIISKESMKYSIENIIKKCDACVSAKNEIYKNVNFRICMEVLFMKLKE